MTVALARATLATRKKSPRRGHLDADLVTRSGVLLLGARRALERVPGAKTMIVGLRVPAALARLEAVAEDEDHPTFRAACWLLQEASQMLWQVATAWQRLTHWPIHRAGDQGIPTDDLRADCALALYQAASTFDPGKGGFAAWAKWYVSAALDAAIAQGSPVQLPQRRVVLQRNRVLKLVQTEGRTIHEAACVVGISPAIATALWASQRTGPVEDDVVAEVDVEAAVDAKVTERLVRHILDRYAVQHPLRAQALRMHYGIDCDPLTRNQISTRIGQTPGQVQSMLVAARHDLATMLADLGATH